MLGNSNYTILLARHVIQKLSLNSKMKRKSYIPELVSEILKIQPISEVFERKMAKFTLHIIRYSTQQSIKTFKKI